MNDQFPQPEDTNSPAAAAPLSRAASQNARRQLLRAVGATGALAGIGLPLSAHATTRPHCVRNSNNYHATASAVGSMIGSTTGGTPPIYGHTCAHYCNSGNWTGYTYTNGRGCTLTHNNCANTGTASSSKLWFWQVFELSNPGPPSSIPSSRYCATILNSYGTSDEAIWLTALLNATKRNQNGNVFPYTPTQVIDLYKGLNPLMGGTSSSGITSQALTLFRDYLSSMS